MTSATLTLFKTAEGDTTKTCTDVGRLIGKIVSGSLEY